MSVAARLQIKGGQSVSLLHVPGDVHIDLPEGCTAAAGPDTAHAVIVFAANRAELGERAEPFVAAARRDALAWIAYPKAGQLDTDLNRDLLWELLSGQGIRPVRQVAVDMVWSALRFRPDPSPA